MDLAGFDQTEKVGETSRAEIWKARQIRLERTVCLRVLKPAYASNPDEVRAFIEPARAAAKLKHSNLVQIYDIVEKDGQCYVVMEYVAGMLLSNVLVNGPVPQRRAMQIARAVAGALNHAWRTSRLVHRNIKPAAIALSDVNVAKIADVSLATTVDEQGCPAAKEQDTIQGTPNYIAPELVRGPGALDFRSDMYSLGATLYHMVTGVVPFAGVDQVAVLDKQVDSTIPNPRDVLPGISSGTAKIIQRMMMKNPLDRYQNWADAMRDMEKVAGSGFLVTKSADNVPRPSTVADPVSQVDEQAEREAALRDRPFPFLLRALLWLVLVSGLTVLFLYRLGLPVNDVFAHYASSAFGGRQGPTETVAVTPASAIPAPNPGRGHPPTPAPEPRLTPGEQVALDKAREDLAALLVARQPAKALDRLQWELGQAASAPVRQELDALKPIIKAASEIDRTVIQEFEGRIGKEVTVNLRNGAFRLRLQAIAGDNVCGSPIANDGTVSTNLVVFRTTSMDPVERSKWLGAAPTPERGAMKYLLYMESGDYESAAAFALRCGPFAQAFAAIARQKQSTP
jgi:serine/threonine-protein kinase